MHKVWKDDVGPVAPDDREPIWEAFSAATKVIHERRRVYLEELDESYKVNQVEKEKIIAQINAIATDETPLTHKLLQNQIKERDALREAFFNAGKVPLANSDDVWNAFKESTELFNKKKAVL